MPPSRASSATALASNKDLSCLRCRKKKAKCSKTRPACTRCARSNQPCEYPDAPPNLSDLSQKVLGLYDTLRELEDKFMVQYALSLEQGENATGESEIADAVVPAGASNGDYKQHNSVSPVRTPLGDVPIPASLPLQQMKRQNKEDTPSASEQYPTIDGTVQPGSWSMSLTSEGLSLHAVARNVVEFTTFAKDFTQQLRYNNPTGIPVLDWYDDDEEEEDEDEDEEPLDEDEYLVTVPSYPITPLLGPPIQKETASANANIASTAIPINTTADDTLQHILDARIGEILNDLRPIYDAIERGTYPVHQLHAAMLLKHLHLAYPFLYQAPVHFNDRSAQFCILTAYATSSTLLLLPPIASSSSQSTHSAKYLSTTDCVDYAIHLLKDILLQPSPHSSSRAIVAGATLLGWISQSTELIRLAIQVLCGSSDCDPSDESWQQLAALVLYVETVSCIFRGVSEGDEQQASRTMSDDAKDWLLRAAGRLCTQQSVLSSTLGLEAQLACFLKQVYMLFYESPQSIVTTTVGVRKIDVDDVLNLVRDIESWEQRLPDFAQWKAKPDEEDMGDERLDRLRMHIHTIHNSVKILLFRPFSTTMRAGREIDNDDSGSLQTHTRTTFLDLSLASTERLIVCLRHSRGDTEGSGSSNVWLRAARCLAQDVVHRVRLAFPCDEELLKTLEATEMQLLDGRADCASSSSSNTGGGEKTGEPTMGNSYWGEGGT